MSKIINLSGLKTLLEPLIHLIDKKAERPDWNENDPNSPDFIENRPFYTETEKKSVTLIDNMTVEIGDDGWVELAAPREK